MDSKRLEITLETTRGYERVSVEDRKKYLKQFFTYFMFTEAITLKKTNDLADFYEKFIIDNDELIRMAYDKRVRPYTTNFYDRLKLDIIFVLADRITEDAYLMDMFMATYSSRFTKYDFILDVIEMNNDDISRMRSDEFDMSFQFKMDSVRKEYDRLIRNITSAQEFFFYGILFAEFSDVDLIQFPFKFLADKYADLFALPEDKMRKDFNAIVSKKIVGLDNYIESIQLQKYIKLKRHKIMEYFECSEPEELYDKFRSFVLKEHPFVQESNYLYAFANMHCISFALTNGMVLTNEEIDELIKSYYEAKALKVLREIPKSSLNKSESIHFDEDDDILDDIKVIARAVDFGMHISEIEFMLAQYYKDFSANILRDTEAKTNRHHYLEQTGQYEDYIDFIENQLQRLHDEKKELRKLLREATNKRDDMSFQEHQDALFRKEIDNNHEEIEQLKQQLRSRDEYIALLESNQIADDIVDSNYDLEKLQLHKYLFVCRESDIMQALKKRFPNSIFMTNNTKDISDITVDAVVYIINCISHSIFYKVKSTLSGTDIKQIYANNNNIDMICTEIYRNIVEQ